MAWVSRLAGIVRAPFLLLVPACLAPAYAAVYVEQGFVDPVPALLVFAAALSAHIGVNALNEYEDFRSGLDFTTDRTPFSGGSGTLVADPAFAPVALFVGWTALLITVAIGLFFLLQIGTAVVIPGLLGVVIAITYTRWLNRFPLLCLVAPGLGFGVLVINLAILVLTGGLLAAGFWLSLAVALLVSNLLLVNQFPDVDADRRAGRNHVPIAWGMGRARTLSVLLTLAAYLVLVGGWLTGALPAAVLLAWLTLPVAIRMHMDIRQCDETSTFRLIPAMGKNVAVTLLTPVLMATGVLLAG